MQIRGFSIYNPSEHLEQICGTDSCQHDTNAQVLKKCKNVVLVLGPGALDDCIGDHQCKDKTHRIVKSALQNKDCNIIPVTEGDFQFPDLDELPEDMRALCHYNSVR